MIRFAATVALFALFMSGTAKADALTECGDRTDPQKMVSACTVVIEDPQASETNKGVAFLYRCQAKDMLGDANGALPDCLEAQWKNQDDPSLYNSLTIIYLKLDQPAKALEAADRGVALKPNDGNYINGRANARCAQGQYEGAYSDRLRALELGRFSAKGLQGALQKRGYYDGALDGQFGPGSKAALKDWTFAGCP